MQSKVIALAISLLSLFSADASAARNYEKDVVRYAKALDIQKLDPLLPSQPLREWLESGPPRLGSLQWQVSPNCDRRAKKSEPERRWPLCVKFFFRRGVVQGFGMVRVGTVGEGADGIPELEGVTVTSWKAAKDGVPGSLLADGSSRLSDLPRLLDQIAFEAERPDVIAYGKSVDVKDLDSALPSRRLEEWLRFGPPRLERLEWRISFGCELKAAARGEGELPLCVRVAYSRGDVSGWIMVRIGTVGRGIGGPLSLVDIVMEPRYAPGNALKRGVWALSTFPVLLDEVASEVDRTTKSVP